MKNNLAKIAAQLMRPGKGILAADESTKSISKKFAGVRIVSTVEKRRQYRELLFTTPGMSKYISGVIMYDETIRQVTTKKIPFVKYLKKNRILPGIKVDQGLIPLAPSSLEQITQGLAGLETRLLEYKKMGAVFTKWRAVFTISALTPSSECIKVNAQALAEYAKLVQKVGLVPIVEPEVLMSGAHDIKTNYRITKKVLQAVFRELKKAKVQFSGMLLKPNMVLAGEKNPRPEIAEGVALYTARCLAETIPTDLGGIVFLSGGQSEDRACKNLAAIVRLKGRAIHCNLSYSFGRALQNSAIVTWKGKQANRVSAQKVFLRRCKMASQASLGKG
ncbi:MAG TPA: class I fructose-bisphosphate aldolase [Patescibacteria group bacterium]|nr:class I fructose-bisphosphate aldolase [Patescibacteria group bacterium]